MQVIKQQRSLDKWYLLTSTSSLSTTMAFDRLRMSNTPGIEVGIIDPQVSHVYTGGFGQDARGLYFKGNPDSMIQQIQPFHTGGGWTGVQDEHDFSFDCSSFEYFDTNPNSDSFAPIVIKGIDETNIFWQLYAYPTGYGGTRNKDAKIGSIDYSTMNIGPYGGQIGRLRLTNQGNVLPYEVYAGNANAPLTATEVRLENTSEGVVMNMMRSLVLGGATAGTLSYTEEDRPKNGNQQAIDDYVTLTSRSWNITGGTPT